MKIKTAQQSPTSMPAVKPKNQQLEREERPVNYKFQYQEPPIVVHRSSNRIICKGDTSKYAQSNRDGQDRGFHSPKSEAYKPIGVFQKVVPVIEELKTELDNSVEF